MQTPSSISSTLTIIMIIVMIMITMIMIIMMMMITMIMMVMVITLRILQITKQCANYNHCSELFTGINIVLKLRHFFYHRYLQQIYKC